MIGIHQLNAGFALGDAISSETLILQRLLKELGYSSKIYVDRDHDGDKTNTLCQDYLDMPNNPNDILIHHYGGKTPVLDSFKNFPGKKIIIYHNITPSHYFEGYNDSLAKGLKEARDNLPEVCSGADASWAVSEFNAEELRSAGVQNVQVFPLLFDAEQFEMKDSGKDAITATEHFVDFLFVGRVVPNKNIENLLHAFTLYNQGINQKSRLFIIGSEYSCPRYFNMLQLLRADMSCQHIHFQRFIPDEFINSYYRQCDAFITCSEHEGYCLPLIEAMYKGLPVIAPANGGMPEAMGDAGVIYEDLNAHQLAALMHKVTSDKALESEILESQATRIQRLKNRDALTELSTLLSKI